MSDEETLGDEASGVEESEDDFGPPFSAKTFGGAFVWGRAPGYVTTVLRVREGKNVPISTKNRCDMTIMLTAGRAVLEVHDDEGADRVELMPAAPVSVSPGATHRLLAMTEVELFTVYTPLTE